MISALSLAPLDRNPLDFGLTAEGIVRVCEESLARAEQLLTELRGLASVPEHALTFESTLGKLDDAVLAIRTAADFPQLMAAVHPDRTVREAAKECEPKVDKYLTNLYLDASIASVLKRYAGKKEPLSTARARFLEHTLRDYRRNGLELDKEGQERLRQLNEEITQLSQQFETNLAESTLFIEISSQQLEGLPKAYIESHKPNETGTVRITTDYPDYFPFLQYVKDRNAALELFKKFNNRAADKNVHLLEKLLELRCEKAKLLGYNVWADYVLETRMAKNPKAVMGFLEGLRAHLKTRVEDEVRELHAMQIELGGGPEDSLSSSDTLFLVDQLCQKRYALDSKELSEYLELESIKKALLDITSQMYTIRYRSVDEPVWHPDVTAVEVLSLTSEVIGKVYFDLYPRPDKFKHAAVFEIRSSKTLANGKRLVPMAALVCNFPKPTDSTPALLSHQDVITFFHEFGHVLHQVLTESELATYAGTSVARDFVEAPSQMFEEWAWSRETLDLFAKHYRTQTPIPDNLYSAMLRARSFGRALSTQRQLFLASLDLEYHTRWGRVDSTQVVREVHAKYMPFPYLEGTHFQATFGHLIGYDAGYYGYQWALSIARDLLTRFETEGMLNPETSRDYRAVILAPGGSDEEARLVERFLKRPLNDQAYKRYLSAQ